MGNETQWSNIVKGAYWAEGTPSNLVVRFNFYIISFDPNGGTGKMEEVHVGVNEGCILPENIFEYEGYHFAGWRDTEGNIYGNQESIACIVNDMLLCAVWDIDQQLVILDIYDQENASGHSGGIIDFVAVSRLEENQTEEQNGTCRNITEISLNGVSELRLTAVPDDDCGFIGWFNGSIMENGHRLLPGDNLISMEPEYSMIVQGDETQLLICAVFSRTHDLILPASITAIEEEAFEGISATVVYVPDGCLYIGKKAFMNSSVYRVFVPADCELAEDVFEGCKLVYLISAEGSLAQQYCETHSNCLFVNCD